MKKFGTVWLCALLLSSSAFGIIDVSEGAKGEIVTRNGLTLRRSTLKNGLEVGKETYYFS